MAKYSLKLQNQIADQIGYCQPGNIIFNFAQLWQFLPGMAVGRCQHSLRHHWHRPVAETGDVYCTRKMRRRERMVETVRLILV